MRISRGFTLLEILVVIVIIGVIVSAATLSVGVLGGDRELEDEARRIWAVLQQAREETEVQGMSLGLFASAQAYEFFKFNPRRTEWQFIDGDELYRARKLPEGLKFRLWLDNREVVLKPRMPDRSDEDEHKRNPPQILVLASGEVQPFELQLERDGAPAPFRVIATTDNDLRLERRDPGANEWKLVSQTNEPREPQGRT